MQKHDNFIITKNLNACFEIDKPIDLLAVNGLELLLRFD